MKKSLIALAVAGAFAAPAFAATSNVDVYGIVSIAVTDNNNDGVDMAVTDNVSRIGFKGSEDLGGGLKAIWQIENAITDSATSAGVGKGNIAGRNTFVGLAGGFGTFLMGRHDTPYKLGTASLDPFVDTIGDYNGYNTSGYRTIDLVNAAHDYRSPQAIAYISPTWSGFHFAAAVIATNDTANLNKSDKAMDAYSLTGVYSNGPLFASLSYQDVKNATPTINSAYGVSFPDGLKSDATKLGLGYTFGDAKVGFIYEDVNVDGEDYTKSWLINGVYNMGPIALKAEYGRLKFDGSDSYGKTVLGADYNLSKRTTAYLVYTRDQDYGFDGSLSSWSLGMKHSF